MFEGRKGCEGFNGFIAQVCGDGFLSTSVIAFEDGEEEVEGIIVFFLPGGGHRGVCAWHMAIIASELLDHTHIGL
jgi:hypothetical protein